GPGVAPAVTLTKACPLASVAELVALRVADPLAAPLEVIAKFTVAPWTGRPLSFAVTASGSLKAAPCLADWPLPEAYCSAVTTVFTLTVKANCTDLLLVKATTIV